METHYGDDVDIKREKRQRSSNDASKNNNNVDKKNSAQKGTRIVSTKMANMTTPVPSYMDYYNSVTSSTYGTARLGELTNLWRSMISKPDVNDGGTTVSSFYHRRRTRSHLPRRRHRFPEANHNKCESEDKNVIKKSRKGKRQIKSWLQSCHSFSSEENKWLMTHLWHVKRFLVSDPLPAYGNFRVPIQHTQRGTHASIRRHMNNQNTITIQDATYEYQSSIKLKIEFESDNETQQTFIQNLFQRHFGIPFSDLAKTNDGKTRCFCQTNVRFYKSHPTEFLCPIGRIIISPSTIQKKEEAICYNIVLDGIPSSSDKYYESTIISLLSVTNNYDTSNVIVKTSMMSTKDRNCSLRLRGPNTLNSFQHISNSNDDTTTSNNKFHFITRQQKKIRFDDALTAGSQVFLPHGTMIPLFIFSGSNGSTDDVKQKKHEPGADFFDEKSSSNSEDDDNFISWPDYVSQVMLEDDQYEDENENLIWIISHLPPIYNCANETNEKEEIIANQKISDCNWGIIGYDILVSQKWTNKFYQSLVFHGHAYPIAYVDYVAACLEANPPFSSSLWPLNYPESKDGQEYYDCGKNDKVIKKWCLLKTCAEYSVYQGGRIQTIYKHLIQNQHHNCCHEKNSDISPKRTYTNTTIDLIITPTIDWKKLLSHRVEGRDDNYNENMEMDEADSTSNDYSIENIAVVRDRPFLEPFVQVMNLAATNYNYQTDNDMASTATKKKRIRRPRKDFICTPPLTPEESKSYKLFCETLYKSLSLPALLHCHIIIQGKGTMMPGSSIFMTMKTADERSHQPEQSEETLLLGYVVLSAFSPTRGKFHGIGFISARKFLRYHLYHNNVTRIITSNSRLNNDEKHLKQVAIEVNVTKKRKEDTDSDVQNTTISYSNASLTLLD